MNKVIMLLANAFDPDPRVYSIAEVLAKSNYEVTIFAWDRQRRYPENDLINKICIKRCFIKSTYGKGLQQLFAFILFQLKAFIFLLRNDFDIVHPNDFDTLVPAFLAAKLKRKKIVYDCHEDYPAMMKDRNLYFISFFIEKAESFIVRRLDLIFVASPTFEESFKRRGAKKVKVILNCKNIDDYIVQKDEIRKLRKRLGANNKFIFLYIGRLAQDRNLEELMKIFRETTKPRILFVIGGSGILEKRIEREVSACQNINFIKMVPPKEVPLYTKAADVLLAIYSKNNLNNVKSVPNKIFESIAAAKPIIASKYGLIGKIINETECGIAIEPDDINEIKDVITKVSSDKKTVELISKNALKAQKKYNWQEVSRKLVVYYESMMKNG